MQSFKRQVQLRQQKNPLAKELQEIIVDEFDRRFELKD